MADGPSFMGSLTEEDINLAKEAGFDISKYVPESSLTREGYRPVEEADYETSWSDYGRALTSGGAGVVSGLAAGTEYLTGGALGADTRKYFGEISEDQIKAMSPVGRRAIQAEFLPSAGETSIFDNFTSSLGLKTVAALPSVVSSIIPAGLAAKALQGASLATRVGVAGATARGVAGLQAGGDVAGQIYSTIERMSDQELQDKAPIYAGYRSMMSEAEARRQYMNEVAGAAPAAAFLLTAALGGVEGQIAGRFAGEAARGVLRGAGRGALAEAAQETVESGGGELLAQLALADKDLAQLNWQKVLSKGLEGGLVGGVLGGGVGGVSNIGAREEVVAPPASPAPPSTAPAVVPPKGAGTGAAPQPASGPQIGDPNARPTRSETQYPKGREPFSINTIEQRLAAKNIPFPEERREELQARVEAIRNMTKGRNPEIAKLLNQLYAELTPAATPTGTQTIAPGVQVGAGPDAAQTVALNAATPVKPVPAQVSAAVQRQTAPAPTRAPAPARAPARPTAPVPAPVAAAVQRQAAPVDTGTNLQEPDADLLAQQERLVRGEASVQMFPTNTTPLPLPKGMKEVVTARGVFHYNPKAKINGKAVNKGLIERLSAAGRENELLNLGDRTKQEVAAAAPAEGGVTTVSEVTPEGARVRSVATTVADAERQAQMLQEEAAPENDVKIEPPPVALAPRVLEDITPEGQAARAAAEEALFANVNKERVARERAEASAERAAAVEGKVGKEAMLTKDEQRAAKIAEDEQAAAEVVANNKPTAAEDNLQSKNGAERKAAMQAMYDRLKKMVAEAEQRGIKIPDRQRKQADDLILLMRAKKFLAARAPSAAKGGLGTVKPYQEFVAIETSLRGGREAAQAERDRAKAEAEAAKKPVGKEPEAAPTEERGTLSQAAEQAAMTPEERMIAAEEAATELTEEEVFAAGRERELTASAAARAADEDAIRAIESQEGKFKVAKRPVAEKLRPTVTGKISLKPKTAAAVATSKVRASAAPKQVMAGEGVIFDTWESRQGNLKPVPNVPPQFVKVFENIREITDSLLNKYWADDTLNTLSLQAIENDLDGISARRISVAEFIDNFTRNYNNLPASLAQQYASLQPELNDALGTAGQQAGSEIVNVLRRAIALDRFEGHHTGVLEAIAEYEDGNITPHQLAQQAFWSVPNRLSDSSSGKLWMTRFVDIQRALEKVRTAYPQTGATIPGLEYKTGKPAVADAFHGAPVVIEKFNKEFLGRNTNAPSAREAFFFARNPDTSNNTTYTGSVGGYRERAYPAWYEETTARMFLRTYLQQNVRTTPVGKNWDQITAQFTEAEQNSFDAGVRKYRAVFDKYQKLTKSGVSPIAEDNAFEKMMATLTYRTSGETKSVSADDDLAALRMIMDDVFDMLENITNAAAGRQVTKPNLVLARIFFENPYVVDQKGSRYREKSYYEAISDAKRRGHDGVIFLNTFDGGPQDVIYAVFNEDQISDRFLPGRSERQLFPSVGKRPLQRANYRPVTPTGNKVSMAGIEFVPVQATDVARTLRLTSDDLYAIFRDGPARLFATFFKAKLTERVGNIPVYVVTDEDMDRMYSITAWNKPWEKLTVNGLYYDGKIALRASALADPVRGLELALHEALHAWSEDAINSDVKLQQALDKLVDVARIQYDTYFRNTPSIYGLTDRYEFISEAFSNPQFRDFLTSITLTDYTRQQVEQLLGPVKGPFKSAWDAFIQLIRSKMGLGDTLTNYTMLDAVMHAGVRIDMIVERRGVIGDRLMQPQAPRAAVSAQDIINSSVDRKNAYTSWGKRNWAKFLTGSQMRQQYADTVIGPALKKIWESVSATGPRIQEIKDAGDKLATLAIDLSNKYGNEFRSLVQIMQEARMMDVNIEGNNDHLGKDATKGWQAKGRLADLQSRFYVLPPELKQLYRDMAKFYRDSHNEIVRSSVTSILEGLQLRQARGKAKGNALTDQEIAALTTRVMDQTMTAADKALLGVTVFNGLKNAAAFHRIRGDYFPLMRYGDHVVTTTDKIKDTMGGTLETPDTVLFRDKSNTAARRAAEAFVKKSDLVHMSTEKVFFDNATGKEVSEDDAKSLNDVDIGYRVTMQTKGVYFFESGKAAEEFARANPEGHDQISKPEMRMGSGYQAQIMSGTQIASLNSAIDGRVKSGDITDGQGALLKSIVNQAATRMLGGNRIASRRLKSQKVTGASSDVARNLLQYNAAMANHIAVAENAPVIRDGLTEMTDALKNYSGDDRPQLVAVAEEVKARIDQGIVEPNAPGKIMKDIMSLSFLARLFSPAYSVINGMQPFMVTLPILGGRYGNMAASAAMTRAYSDIGLGGAALEGVLNTARATKQTFKAALLGTDDVVGNIRKKLSNASDGADITRMMDELIRQNAIDVSAGLEVAASAAEGRGTWGKTLAGVDRIARQLPQVVEAVNRSVSAVAAYRLARQDGQTHEQATQFALDTVQNTQGDYSAANAPRFFNNPILRPALQFKKYAQMMTYLLGDMAYRVFNGATPEEKKIALKQLGNILGVQILMAGALSLPGLEIIKAGFLIASMLGIGGGWDEQEEKLRKMLDASVGKTWGELISSGILSRAIGIDLSQRMSLADMWLFGEPKGDSAESIQAYLFRQAVGAPGSLLLDWRDAIDSLVKGEPEKAAGKIIPIKFASDFAKAAVGYQQGKTEPKEERKKVSGLGEAAANVFGFRTGRQAEAGRQVGVSIREREAKQKEFKKLQQQFYRARTKGEQIKAIAKNREWNDSLSPNEWRLRLPVKPRKLETAQ